MLCIRLITFITTLTNRSVFIVNISLEREGEREALKVFTMAIPAIQLCLFQPPLPTAPLPVVPLHFPPPSKINVFF